VRYSKIGDVGAISISLTYPSVWVILSLYIFTVRIIVYFLSGHSSQVRNDIDRFVLYRDIVPMKKEKIMSSIFTMEDVFL